MGRILVRLIFSLPCEVSCGSRTDRPLDDQLLELVGDLCNFILDQIVHVKGTYHDRESELGINSQYQHFVRLKG